MFQGIPVMLMTSPSGSGFQGLPVRVVNASEVGMQPSDIQATAPLQATDGDSTVTLSLLTDTAGGVPVLDGSGLIKLAQMPISGLNYHGNWDASTNTPTLADGTGAPGDFYRVSVAGTQDLGSGSLAFEVGDHVVYEGSTWQRFDAPSQVSWGDIIGTLSAQTDLQAALDAKLTTPTPLVTKVVLGTSLSQNTIGLVGYDQDVLGDMLVMRRFSGAVAGATAAETDELVTLAQLNAAIAGVGTQSDLGTPQSHNSTDVFLTASSPTVQLISTAIGDVLVHLPEASAVSAGKRYIIKRLTAGASGCDIVSGDVNGALIDGVSDIGMAAQYSVRDVLFDGTNWQIISSSGS